MDHIDTLLKNESTEQNKLKAVNDIIEIYNLSIDSEPIINACAKIRKYLLSNDYGLNSDLNRKIKYCTLLNHALNEDNSNMFLALIYAINNNYYIGYLQSFGLQIDDGTYSINCKNMSENIIIVLCELQNYHRFKVDNLHLVPSRKQKVCDYVKNLYGGNLTKGAIKN